MRVRLTLSLLVILFGLLASAPTPRPVRAQPPGLREMSVPAPSSCDEGATKAKLYRRFLDNFKGNVEQQKVAYETGKEYIARYGDCPGEFDKKVAAYIRSWLAKYEEAASEWRGRQQ